MFAGDDAALAAGGVGLYASGDAAEVLVERLTIRAADASAAGATPGPPPG